MYSANAMMWAGSAAAALALFMIPGVAWMTFLLSGGVALVLLTCGAPEFVVFPGNLLITYVGLLLAFRLLIHIPARWSGY